jgi:hypothetical protein
MTVQPDTKEALLKSLRELDRPMTSEDVGDILESTIRHDRKNKVIAFYGMLLTFTEEDQINISFTAESCTGKSYTPLELAWYFPKEDIIEYSYVSPTAFFHEYGALVPDPTDSRDVEDEKKHKIVIIDLSKKILIFIDQPHDMLLQRLRPLLSHDRKTLVSKITDKREKGGLRTKTAVIKGYPTVVFCTAKFSMEDQERTRLLLLSPETTTEKIKDSILLKIQKDSDREAFNNYMESDPQRKFLATRVWSIKRAQIKHVIIPSGLRSELADRFFKDHSNLIPRHMRDIGRLLALVKANALLNHMHRQRVEDHIMADSVDVQAGFELYASVSTANELGLPPAVYETFTQLKPDISEYGVTRKEFQQKFYEKFHRVIGSKRLDETLQLLQTVGLLNEEPDPADKRQKRFYLVQKLNTPEGWGNTEDHQNELPPSRGVYSFLRKGLKTPFLQEDAEKLIVQTLPCTREIAEKLFQDLVDGGQVFMNGDGTWQW